MNRMKLDTIPGGNTRFTDLSSRSTIQPSPKLQKRLSDIIKLRLVENEDARSSISTYEELLKPLDRTGPALNLELDIQEKLRFTFSDTSLIDSDTILPDYDRGKNTKLLCILGLAFSWLVILVCIILRPLCIAKTPASLYKINLSLKATEALSFAMNGFITLITLITNALGYIHGTSLKWALFRCDRLQFNANLRPFTSIKNYAPNRWPANLVCMASLFMCYAASSQLFLGGQLRAIAQDLTSEVIEPSRTHINGVAFLMLGLGLLGKTSIATWIMLLTSKKIVTWNSNSINNMLAFINSGPREKKAMVVVLYTRNANESPTSWNFSPSWYMGALESISDENLEGWNALTISSNTNMGNIPWPVPLFINVLIQCAVQLVPVTGIHAVELVVNISRDESACRAAYDSRLGARMNANAFASAALNWQNIVLLVSKPALHWTLGQALSSSVEETKWPHWPSLEPSFIYGFSSKCEMLYMRVLVYSILASALAIFTTFLACRRPRGPQPTTYGNYQTLANLIYDRKVNEKGAFWWGDKGVRADGFRQAGTSSEKELLGNIKMDALYKTAKQRGNQRTSLT